MTNEKLTFKQGLITAVNGILMGIANIIPGVSGGTFALILGIFDRIVNAVNSIGISTVKAVLLPIVKGFNKESRDSFIDEMKRIDALFLLILVASAGIAAVGLAFVMEYLLVEQTTATLAFFIGLIVPSILVPYSMMDKKGPVLLWTIPGIALTLGISFAMPDNAGGVDNPLIAAGAGALAISAMILPGISGSFILLILGQYQVFIGKATGFISALGQGQFDIGAFIWLVAFALGMLVGLLAFSRLLAWLLKKAKSSTMAFLTGLIIGSLFVLWPFKDMDAGAKITGRDGEVKQDVQIATAQNRLPETAEESVAASIALLLGFAGSAGMMRIGKRKENDQ